jgi:hypothetical protein
LALTLINEHTYSSHRLRAHSFPLRNLFENTLSEVVFGLLCEIFGGIAHRTDVRLHTPSVPSPGVLSWFLTTSMPQGSCFTGREQEYTEGSAPG